MIRYENDDLLVKESPIEGLGIFAKRDFRIDEVVLRWRPIRRLIEGEEVADEDKRYVHVSESGERVLMNEPERYMNHSCDPNTRPVGESDVAVRDIKAGEEITSDYQAHDDFTCSCGIEKCRGRR